MLVIIVLLFLLQSVHRAFRSFSLFCHGLLAGDYMHLQVLAHQDLLI